MSNGLRKLLLITATLLCLLLSPIFENVTRSRDPLKNDKNPQAAVSSEFVPSTDARHRWVRTRRVLPRVVVEYARNKMVQEVVYGRKVVPHSPKTNPRLDFRFGCVRFLQSEYSKSCRTRSTLT